MADFKTHLAVASTASGILAIGCLVAGVATPKEVVLYYCAGTIGGVLPDLDSDHALPVQILFGLLALVLAFVSVFSKADAYSIVELACVWILVYVVIRYLPYKIFIEYTVHRGIFHSLLAGLFFCFLTTAAAYQLFNVDTLTAWMIGSFVALGYLIHLLLDEIYSVDVTGARIKKSFGTALKPAGINLRTSVALGVATVALFFLATPATDAFRATFANRSTYASLQEKLLPKDRWFNLPILRHAEAAGHDDIPTGSIPRGK